MEKYEVLLYPKAYQDIDDIYSYLAYNQFSPETAKNQTDKIWKAIENLEFFPNAHQDRMEGRYAGKGYKQLIVDSYLVIFKIIEEFHQVYIITIQHQCRNI